MSDRGGGRGSRQSPKIDGMISLKVRKYCVCVRVKMKKFLFHEARSSFILQIILYVFGVIKWP